MRRHRCAWFLFLMALLVLPWPALAQAGGRAILSGQNLAGFPTIEAYLKVIDEAGGFIHGLQAEQVTIVEDSTPRPVDVLEELQPGAQVVVAINPGPSFAIRNARAISRYDILKDALRIWANGRAGSSLDDYSLLITGGPATSHTADSLQWLKTLESDPTDARSATPDLDTLYRALSLAADNPPRTGMGRMVLFITPPPEGQAVSAIDNLAAQASEHGIPITIWLVSSSGAAATQGVQKLQQLAASTGGQFFIFTGEEVLPDIESYLADLRSIYHLTYTSRLNASGPHTLAAQVQAGETVIETPPVNIGLDLQAPQAAFISPPSEIIRQAPVATPTGEKQSPIDDATLSGDIPNAQLQATSGDEVAALEVLIPTEIDLQVVVDFPDGRKRDIVYSALTVDGVVVDENTAPPFDSFTWPLTGYTESGLHQLQVQVRDVLQMSGQSVERPVQVKVVRPKVSPLGWIQRSLPILGVLTALLAGSVLLLVLVLGGQISPRSQRTAAHNKQLRSDPVTQPVHIPSEPVRGHRPGWMSRLQRPQRSSGVKVEAYLTPIPDPDEQDTVPPIPIPIDGLRIGSDSSLATLVLDESAVEKLHANLIREADGSYRLADEGTTAGTWVNYTPVSREGIRLEHGDLLHIGRVGFRFTLSQPAYTRRPVVISEPVVDILPEPIPDTERAVIADAISETQPETTSELDLTATFPADSELAIESPDDNDPEPDLTTTDVITLPEPPDEESGA